MHNERAFAYRELNIARDKTERDQNYLLTEIASPIKNAVLIQRAELVRLPQNARKA